MVSTMPTYQQLEWNGPFLVAGYDFSGVPPIPGFYVFSESDDALKPNPRIPPEGTPGREKVLCRLRSSPCIFYVGKSRNLRRRLPGYRFRPYLEIKRRPKGTPPKHVADRHRGRALLHAQQYFHHEGLERPLYLRWAHTTNPGVVEEALIEELQPTINAVGMAL